VYFHWDYLVHPFGANNDLPDIIKQTVNQLYRSWYIEEEDQLIWGMGPVLYKEKISTTEGNKRVRENIRDPEIDAWLESYQNIPHLKLSPITNI
jgi:hypothetical protein